MSDAAHNKLMQWLGIEKQSKYVRDYFSMISAAAIPR